MSRKARYGRSRATLSPYSRRVADRPANHQKPNAAEIAACRPWLNGELAAVSPQVLVALGATAAQALLGRSFRVTLERGVPVESDLAPHVLATVRPSSILRAPDEAARRDAYDAFVTDLRNAARLVGAAEPRK